MGSNLVIVAIPDENDRVWKVSSEKVPHLTLLFLGEADKVQNLDQIMQFVEHASNTMLNRFYLSVDRRDKLGADDADVLFFRKGGYDVKAVREFRNALLKDTNIKTAYDSATQFEGWTPHLTLGYPATPAKPIPDNEIERFYDVQFNKIAVWVGDFEGPEFLLKDYWDEMDLLAEPALAMSSMNQERVKLGLEALDHSGVKGMKWGVRKIKSGAKRAATAIGDVNFESRVESGKAREAVINQAHGAFHKDVLPKINAKPEYQNAKRLKHRLTNRKDPLTKQYRTEVKSSYIKQLEKTANSMENASGTRQYTIRERGVDLPAAGGKLPTSKHYWDISSRNLQHAADAHNGITTVEVVMDEDGFITELKPVTAENTMAQSAMYGEAFVEGLMHFGIKGMKWGVRKPPPSPVATSATSKVPHGDKRKTKIEVEGGQNHPAHEDAIKVAEARIKLKKSGPAALSNQELREVAQRLQLEGQVAVLTSSKGKQFVTQQLQNEGKNLAREGVRTGVKSGIKKSGKTVKKAAATAAVAALI